MTDWAGKRGRRPMRLREFDYTCSAAYFATICTYERRCLFGAVERGEMKLNLFGRIVEEEWRRSEALRANVMLDQYVVMPNHLHGIVLIVPGVRDPFDARDSSGYRIDSAICGEERSRRCGRDMARHVPTDDRVFGQPVAGSLSTIIGAFKSAATRRINIVRGTPGTRVWQRNFHDRIIRDAREWEAIRGYIATNPHRWR